MADEVVSRCVKAPNSVGKLLPQDEVTICGNQASLKGPKEAPDTLHRNRHSRERRQLCCRVSAAVSLLWPKELQAVPCLQLCIEQKVSLFAGPWPEGAGV